MLIHNHLLVAWADEAVSFQKIPGPSSGVSPLYLILHYTAGSSLKGAVSWFLNPAAKASAHLVIGRDGAVVQKVAPGPLFPMSIFRSRVLGRA